MSEADKIFEELGYIKETDDEDFIGYFYNGEKVIGFIKETKEIIASRASMQELQAINAKCKELGWLDE